MKNVLPIIEFLERVPWFQSVGLRYVTVGDMSIVQVDSWKSTIGRSRTNGTSNAWMEGRALVTRELGLHHRLEYRKWNKIVEEVHEALADEVLPRLDAIIDANHDIAVIEDGAASVKDFVRWDIVGAAMEYAYSDLVEPRFYTLLLNVYQAGHFPCGWDEVWPDGKLWVY